MSRTSIHWAAAALIAATGLVAVSCKHEDKDTGRYQPVDKISPEVEANAKRHGPEANELRDVMHQLAEHTAFAPTNELPADPESNVKVDPRVFTEVESLAAALSDTAARIPPGADDVKLFPDEREAFEAEAALLRRHAQDLGAAARVHNVERMQRTFDRINATCINCHSRFRDFAGQLNWIRAEAPSDQQRRIAERQSDDVR